MLKTLPAQSSVQVFTCSDRANFIGPAQRFNLDQARNLIPSIEVTSLSSDLLPGLTEALAAAKTGTAPAKEIYVFTDLQKDAFERQGGAVKAKCEEIKAAANLVFVRCGNADRHLPNIAVADVTWISDIPHTKSRVPFKITLRNTGKDPVKGLKVSLELDGKAVEKDAVQVDQINGGDTATVMLTGSLDEPGVRVVSVQIGGGGDTVPGDNVLYKTILVRDKVRVLLVDGNPNPNNPTDAGDHFVKTALNPGRVSEYYIETESVSATEASAKDLENKDIVYLLNAPIRDADPVVGMSAEFVAKLVEFVKNGGGLVIASGDQVVPAAYNKAFGSAGAGLLPFDITGVRDTPESSPFHPAADTVDKASFLAPFAKYAEALQGIALFHMLDLADVGTGGRVLVKAEGRPYITSKVVAAGEVILITGSLDERWGNFSSDPGSFQVPLAVYTITHLTGRKMAGGTTVAGNPLVWLAPHDAGTAFELVMPPKPGEKLRPRVKLEPSEPNAEGKRTVTATDTTHAGVYHIVPLGKGDESGPLFAVNPDLRESDNLAVASDKDVEDLLGFKPAIISAGAGTEGAVTQLRINSEWTEYVLLFLLVLLVAEAAWAWVCGRAW